VSRYNKAWRELSGTLGTYVLAVPGGAVVREDGAMVFVPGVAFEKVDDKHVKLVAEHAKPEPAGHSTPITLPCPQCGHKKIIAYTLVNEEGEHMNTRYVCTFWPSSKDLKVTDPNRRPRCGWEGWTVPGWDQPKEDS